jgi:hypothetical protein
MSIVFGRFRRLVPEAHRDLIATHRLPKPNWFVGSAESAHISERELRRLRRDPAIRAEIDRVKAAIDRRADGERDDHWAQTHRTYAMHLHHDHRPHRPRPWSATLTAGISWFDELVVYARTRDKLIAKTEKKLRRIAASRGITDPIIRIEDAR